MLAHSRPCTSQFQPIHQVDTMQLLPCAIIAMCCAASKHPFQSVSDPYYIQEVEMLHPRTELPSPSTVSHNVRAIFEDGSNKVKEYFEVAHFSLSLHLNLWFI